MSIEKTRWFPAKHAGWSEVLPELGMKACPGTDERKDPVAWRVGPAILEENA